MTEHPTSPRLAADHLGVLPADVTSVQRVLEHHRYLLVGHRLAARAAEFGARVLGSAGEHPVAAPWWVSDELGLDAGVVVGDVVLGFDAGTLADAAMAVACEPLSPASWTITVLAARPPAELRAVLDRIVERPPEAEHPLQGRIIDVGARGGPPMPGTGSLRLAPREHPPEVDTAELPPPALAAIDDVLGTFARAELLDELGLGGPRTVIVTGPDGSGKQQLLAALAARAVDAGVTVLVPSMAAFMGEVDALYALADVLAPALVTVDHLDKLANAPAPIPARARIEGMAGMIRRASAVDSRVVTVGAVTFEAGASPDEFDEVDLVVRLDPPGPERRRATIGRLTAGLPNLTPEGVADAVGERPEREIRELVRRAVLRHGRDVTLDELRALARGGPTGPASGLYL